MANLYTYALIRSLFEKGQDYIDSFWPLVVRTLPDDRSPMSMESVQELLKSQCGLEVPQHSLVTIVTRATRSGYVVRNQHQCRLTDQGLVYKSSMEGEREVDRRINALVLSAQLFLKESRNIILGTEQIRAFLETFVATHIQFLEQFLNPEDSSPTPIVLSAETRALEEAFASYLAHIEKNDPTHFSTVRELAIGGIISATVHSGSLTEIGRRFEPAIVYLDTNILLRLLELDYPEANEPSLELFRLMQKQGTFTFKIFDFTFEELVSYVRRYEDSRYRFVKGVNVDSIYGHLGSIGWASADVREFLTTIDTKFRALGITQEFTPLHIDKLEVSDARRELLKQYKPQQNVRGQNHDLAAIDLVRKRRGGSVQLLEKSRALFLSQDLKLAMFNAIDLHHTNRQTICEVMVDRVFTTLLWLKNPTQIKDMPLKTIIAAHSKGLMIEEDVWLRFTETLQALRTRKRVDDLDVSVLVYDQNVQRALALQPSHRRDGIDEAWILKSLETAKKRIDDKTAQDLKNQKVSFEQSQRDSEQQRFAERMAALTAYKGTLKDEAVKRAKRIVATVAWFAGIVVVGVSIAILPKVLQHWSVIEPVAWVIAFAFSAILVVAGLNTDAFQWKKRLTQRLFERNYRKKLKHLEILEQSIKLP